MTNFIKASANRKRPLMFRFSNFNCFLSGYAKRHLDDKFNSQHNFLHLELLIP